MKHPATTWLQTIGVWLGLFIAGATFANDAEVNAVIEEHWAWTLENYPEWRLEYGDRSGNRDWTDLSLEAITSRHEALGEFSQRLQSIEPAGLSDQTALNRLMLYRPRQ